MLVHMHCFKLFAGQGAGRTDGRRKRRIYGPPFKEYTQVEDKCTLVWQTQWNTPFKQM